MLEFTIIVLFTIVKVIVVTTVLFLSPLVLTYIERKVAGFIQVRLGPHRVGPFGVLQAVADGIKLLLKEDMTPYKCDKWVFKIAPLLALVPAGAIFAGIPFTDAETDLSFLSAIPLLGDIALSDPVAWYIADMNIAILYVLGIGGISVYGFIMAGWASNSKYALLGGLRSAAQMISYEVALTFACVGVVIMSNSLSFVEIVGTQGGGFWNWNIFHLSFFLPTGVAWFLLFMVAGTAEINRIPFDLAEDEGTLAAGFFAEYSGMRFAFFALAEYLAMIAISALAVLMFLGGWKAPIEELNFIPGIVWFVLKVSFFIYFYMWMRFSLPRYRFDQLMTIGWKVMIPIALVLVVLTGLARIEF